MCAPCQLPLESIYKRQAITCGLGRRTGHKRDVHLLDLAFELRSLFLLKNFTDDARWCDTLFLCGNI